MFPDVTGGVKTACFYLLKMHYNKILYSPYCVIPQPEQSRAAYFRRYYEANKERYASSPRLRYEEKCRAKFGASVVVRKNNSRK